MYFVRLARIHTSRQQQPGHLCSVHAQVKGAQVWDLDLLDSYDSYVMKSLWEGDFGAEIKI